MYICIYIYYVLPKGRTLQKSIHTYTLLYFSVFFRALQKAFLDRTSGQQPATTRSEVCICVCMCIYMQYIYACICMTRSEVFICMYMYVYKHTHTRTRICMCIGIYMYIYIRMYSYPC